MRHHCLDCVRKHLSTAASLEDHAYFDHRLVTFWQVGNLLEASSELRAKDEKFAEYLYAWAYVTWVDDSSKLDFEKLFDLLDKAEEDMEVGSPDMVPTVAGFEDPLWIFYANMAQAAVLYDEMWNGYYKYKSYVLGHMNLAALALSRIGNNKDFHRKMSAILREHRLLFNSDPSNEPPFFDFVDCVLGCKYDDGYRKEPDGKLGDCHPIPQSLIEPIRHSPDGEPIFTEDTRPTIEQEKQDKPTKE